MRSQLRVKLLHPAIIVALLAAIGIGVHYAYRHAATQYRAMPSPDGKYKIVVFRLPQFSVAGPGHAGDGNGFVQLQDRAGHVYQEKDVAMVQNIDRVRWERGKVDIVLFAEWNLPE